MVKNIKYLIVFALTVAASMFISSFVRDWYRQSKHPEISFEKDKIEMDTIYNPAQSEVYFSYKNIGKNDLKIHKIETTCGCTIPTYNTDFLPSQKKDSFKVRYETINKGHFLKEIMIYSNSKTSPDRIAISGYVPFD